MYKVKDSSNGKDFIIPTATLHRITEILSEMHEEGVMEIEYSEKAEGGNKMTKENTLEKAFEDYTGEPPKHEELDFGEDVGRERIWSMADEEYNKEYPTEPKSACKCSLGCGCCARRAKALSEK